MHSKARGDLNRVSLVTDDRLNDRIFTLKWTCEPVPCHPVKNDRRTIGRSNDDDCRGTRSAPLMVIRDVWLREFGRSQPPTSPSHFAN